MLTVVVSTLVKFLPSDILGEENVEDPEVRAASTKEFGLDQPIYIQYTERVGRLIQGDLGSSETQHLYR